MGGSRESGRGRGSLIPRPVLAAWRRRAPWRDDRQVAQDLILSVLAIRVASHPQIGGHLAWRGGTCLHKLHLEQARRYSEDLDYVLIGKMPHIAIRDALVAVVSGAAMKPSRDEITPNRVNLWADVDVPAAGGAVRVKFEVNCDDVSPAFGLSRIEHKVETRFWNEHAAILTYQPAELVGTKFRALAQRRKGRDLSDLWLARRELAIANEDLAKAAHHYLSYDGIAPAQLRDRLATHVRDSQFCNDLDALTITPYDGFDAAEAVRELILWTDEHLDPLQNATRSPNAVLRDQQRWRQDRWAPGRVRCPEYDEGNGHLVRCARWYERGGTCSVHG